MKSLLMIALILFLDAIIYLILRIAQMDYEDNFNGPLSQFGSLKSMSNTQVIYYVAFQFWHVINLFLVILIGIKYYVNKNKHSPNNI